jgi:Cu(I)/Ag(I) efflux system membrane fusion protein
VKWKSICWLVALAACGGGANEPMVVRSQGLEIRTSMDPGAARVGENRFEIELRDAEGRPVEDAELGVKVHMHAMGSMPAMGGPARVSDMGDGHYRADFTLDMGGSWLVELRAKPKAGAMAEAEGSLTVGTPGVRLEAMDAPAETATATPVGTTESEQPGEFRIAPERLQSIGVRLAQAKRQMMQPDLRAAGRVVYDETRLHDVSLKVRGWVGELRVAALGDRVERGEVLFTLYSPELYAAQSEYLVALRAQARARETGAPERADYLVRAARNRLALWDIAAADLDRLTREGQPLEQLPIRSPASGYVVEKDVVAGGAIEPGQRLYRIAPLDRVWVEAEVYEQDIPLVAQGMRAAIEVPALPGRRLEGTVAWVYPSVSESTRTARVRVELANEDESLRPDMFATVHLATAPQEQLVVPLSAVLHAGERSFVFLDLGGGRLRPQPVEVGMRVGEEVEIRAGLEEGQAVVASATFLVASESRLRAALDQW